MNDHKNWKILQIIPAPAGWKAVHCQESEDKEIDVSNRSIICWALVQPFGANGTVQTQVRGIEQTLNELAVVDDLINLEEAGADGKDRNEYFVGYDDPEAHKESDFWIKQGNDRIRAEKDKRSEAKAEKAALQGQPMEDRLFNGSRSAV